MTPIPEGTPRDRRNVAFTIEIDNVNICHLGDIASPLTTQQVDELKPVDVLLAPTGGRCTLNMDQVFQTFQDLDPKILVPMHHETPGCQCRWTDWTSSCGAWGLRSLRPFPA